MNLKTYRQLTAVSIVLTMCIVELSTKACTVTHPFSMVTPYANVANTNINVRYIPPKCSPIQINMMYRHGHRYPELESLKRMKSAIDKLNKNADTIASRINLTLPMALPFKRAQALLITTVGEKEMYGIGKRIKERFPNLFEKPYTPLLYKFQSTARLRTIHSANSLAAGLFENTGTLGPSNYQPIAIETTENHNDPILGAFHICRRWLWETDEGKYEWKKEYYKFRDGEVLERLTQRINQKIGLSKSPSYFFNQYRQLNLEDIKGIFLYCAYDMAMFNGVINKGICSLLDEEAFYLMNYLYDLHFFYYFSSGHQLNYEMACPLLADMYNSLQDAQNNNSGAYTGIFRSGHEETLVPILTLLGVYIKKGEILKANNYREMRNRTFHSSCTNPFSGNIYFTLYRCIGDKYKIQLYVNEHLVKLPCCTSSVDCDLDVFLKYYENTVKNCNLKRICDW